MLIAGDIRLGLDPSLIGDPWQSQLLAERPKRALLCCSRQSGKSTVCALLALHTAIYEAKGFDPDCVAELAAKRRDVSHGHGLLLET